MLRKGWTVEADSLKWNKSWKVSRTKSAGRSAGFFPNRLWMHNYAWLDTIFKLAGKLKKAIPNASEPVDVVVSGVKILNGRDMEAGEFTFTLTQIDRNGNPMAGVAPLTATNIAGNSGEAKEFSFAPLTYDLNDYNSAVYFDSDHKALFYYLVEEKIPDGAVDSIVNGISYSTAKFLVVVRLSYSNRHLEAE